MTLLQLDIRFFPSRFGAVTVLVTLYFTLHSQGIHIDNLDLEKLLNRLLNFQLRCIDSDLEYILITQIRNDGSLLGSMRAYQYLKYALLVHPNFLQPSDGLGEPART